MAKFKDGTDREWSVVIDVWQLKVVREATGFELAKLYADELRRLADLAGDPELLCRVLFALCRDQAARDGVTEEQFFRRIWGDPLAEAFDAIQAAYVDFCPSQRRTPLAALAAKERELAAALTANAVERIQAIDVGDVIRTLSASATSSPASSESTPAPAG